MTREYRTTTGKITSIERADKASTARTADTVQRLAEAVPPSLRAAYLEWERRRRGELDSEAAERAEAERRKQAVERWFRQHVDPLGKISRREREERRLQQWSARVFGDPMTGEGE